MAIFKGLARGVCLVGVAVFAGILSADGDHGAGSFLLGGLIGGAATIGWWRDE